MKVYKHLSEFNPIKNAVVTTGTFDGVHIGHQKIIHRVKEIAHQIAGESVIITFHPHPRLVLFPEDNHLKITRIGKFLSDGIASDLFLV